MGDVLLTAYTVQAVRPACHWWRCPRVCAWFRVRMGWSLVKPPATAGPLSRLGDDLLAAHGPALLRRIRRRPTLPHERAATRGPPDPLFHRRSSPQRHRAETLRDEGVPSSRWQPTGVSHGAGPPV